MAFIFLQYFDSFFESGRLIHLDMTCLSLLVCYWFVRIMLVCVPDCCLLGKIRRFPNVSWIRMHTGKYTSSWRTSISASRERGRGARWRSESSRALNPVLKRGSWRKIPRESEAVWCFWCLSGRSAGRARHALEMLVLNLLERWKCFCWIVWEMQMIAPLN